ncbi:MAG: HDOD domain-containing protein [Deltaproteobacteria bacterium]|nr:HDOD domain-containing protein [Deltaproteobacteria bacterium]
MIEINEETLERPIEDEQTTTQGMAFAVKRAIESQSYNIPMLPEVAISLSEIANKPDVSIRDVEMAVTRDPSIAARIMSVANSAFYSRGTSSCSLRGAIVRLGLAEVRDVAFQLVAQTRIFRVPGYSERMRELLEASQAGGILSRQICQHLRYETDLAYLCGLLHDMGEAIILGIVGNQGELVKKGGAMPLHAVRALVEDYHARVGAHVCSRWGLPRVIVDALLHHHRPDQSTDTLQMATVVRVTDILLAHAGIGVEQRRTTAMGEPLFYRLNLSPLQVDSLLDLADSLKENRDAWLVTG